MNLARPWAGAKLGGENHLGIISGRNKEGTAEPLHPRGLAHNPGKRALEGVVAPPLQKVPCHEQSNYKLCTI